MKKFLVRIELKNADIPDYKKLEEEMKKELFTPGMTSYSKSVTHIQGEYERWGNIHLSDISGAVWRAIRKTGKKCSFTIIKQKSNSITSTGIPGKKSAPGDVE